jgi:predicted RNA binding protein YcfA (HicA-like mRNA interferase family)
VTGPEFARLIEARGWRRLRVHGSHHVYGKEGEAARLSIPMHGRRDLKLGLLRHLSKLSGLTEG